MLIYQDLQLLIFQVAAAWCYCDCC